MSNIPSKRGISSIIGDLLLKSGGDSGKTGGAREGSGVEFSKRLCLVVDDLVKESTRTSDTIEVGSSDDKIIFDGDSENFEVKESQGETNAVYTSVEPSKGDDSDALKEMCDMTVCASQTDAVTGEDLAMTVFSSSNCEETGLLFSNSQTINSFNMNRCLNTNGMRIINHDMEAGDELKSCSCSLCLKAAYIWSDLHCQDIKGRLSVLKKSQKEASSLIQRNNGKGRPTDAYGFNNSKNTENVMGQWRSLFLNVECILARESIHLQDSFIAMSDLREKCKLDLERVRKTHQHNNN